MYPLADKALRLALRAAMASDELSNPGRRLYPEAGIRELQLRGLMCAPPVGRRRMAELLWLLADVGWGDLAVARIYEGHANALWLVARFGSSEQQAHCAALVSAGVVLGVWNTDDPGAPLALAEGRLVGGKNFASGADGVSLAIVTVPAEGGRVMLLVPVSGQPIDRSWWRPTGMRLSGSHIVDFSGVYAPAGCMIGNPDDYTSQPWFTGGAIRFAAAHTGGMHAVHDAMKDHLMQTGRAGDPHQQHRLARSAMAVETGYLWLHRAASAWNAAECKADEDNCSELLGIANAARMAIEFAALEVLELAERSVGAAGFLAPHPLERLARDLRTYLRQPAPDRTLSMVGESISKNCWIPGVARRAQGDVDA